MLIKLLRLYHTVKPLRFEQIYYRLWYRLFPLSKLTPDLGPYLAKTWVWFGIEVIKPSFISLDEVEFLNRRSCISNRSVWNDISYEKLWLYNLHYFDDLNAVDSLSRKNIQYILVKRWILENPPVVGNGWEPYPISLRLVNWIKWYQRTGINDQAIIDSIALQAKALSKQLEYHILGNHLFANAKALVFVGCFLDGKESDRYLRLGLRLLDREIPEQFLDDGGHFELSPMYHSILLWDLLDLINLAKNSGQPLVLNELEDWSTRAVSALRWLDVMTHTDKEISFFNDATIGIAASPDEIKKYALMLGLTSTYVNEFYTPLLSTGYSRINNSAYCLLFDHGAVGPSYLPGHAHADTLSFELSVGRDRFFVNSGTSLYGLSDERHRQRGTEAHNTVIVDCADSSEVWGGFRVARRANVKMCSVDILENSVSISAQHDGYLRFNGGVIHRRTIRASENSILIGDNVSGSFKVACSIFHMHPGITLEVLSNTSLKLTGELGGIVTFYATSPIEIKTSSYQPGFGISVPNRKLVIPLSNGALKVSIELEEGLVS